MCREVSRMGPFPMEIATLLFTHRKTMEWVAHGALRRLIVLITVHLYVICSAVLHAVLAVDPATRHVSGFAGLLRPTGRR